MAHKCPCCNRPITYLNPKRCEKCYFARDHKQGARRYEIRCKFKNHHVPRWMTCNEWMPRESGEDPVEPLKRYIP